MKDIKEYTLKMKKPNKDVLVRVSQKKEDAIHRLIDEINVEVPRGKIKPNYVAKQFVKRTSLKKGELSESYFDDFENDNFHSLNGLLYVNGFFGFKLKSHEWFMEHYKWFIV